MNHHQMIGSIAEFNGEFDDWDVYYERLEQYFEVNDVPDAKRSAFLISVIGSDAYKSLRDLCHPVVPKDKPFEELCELLRKQFSRQVAIYRERTKFYNARHENHENATQWYGRLKQLSVDCKFGSNLEQVLVDKFVTGLRPGQVLDRLCEEGEGLKLEQALDIAINKECAVKDNAYTQVRYQPPKHNPFAGGCIPPPRPCLFDGNPVRSSCPPTGGFTFGSAQPQAVACSFGSPAPVALKSAARFAMMDALDEAEQPEKLEEQPEGLGGSAPAVNTEDGAPEGADRAVAAAANKAKRIRTRRRGRGGRGGGADNASEKNSVDGEARD
uniref:Retrotransposon gag domain-containing protein n=1 Tax=Culex tarsalis TaxID=7177 RepID=A0A1Q3FZN6_CULTA